MSAAQAAAAYGPQLRWRDSRVPCYRGSAALRAFTPRGSSRSHSSGSTHLLDRVVVEEPAGEHAEHGAAVDLALEVEQVAAHLALAARLDVGELRREARVDGAAVGGGEVRLQHVVVLARAHVGAHRHLRAVGEEHDEQAGGHLKARVLGEDDGRDGDEELARDDGEDPAVVVRLRRRACGRKRGRVRRAQGATRGDREATESEEANRGTQTRDARMMLLPRYRPRTVPRRDYAP